MSGVMVTTNPTNPHPTSPARGGGPTRTATPASTRGLARCLTLTLAFALIAACGARQHHARIHDAGESFRYELAQLYVEKGVNQAAVPLLQKILAEKPRDVGARVLYAVVLRDLGLHPQSEREFKFALKLQPRSAEAHAGLGILFDLQRKPADALKQHMIAVRLVPNSARYRNNLGFSLYLDGKIAAAVVQFEQALAMDPGLTIAYNNLGFAYGRDRQFDRAEHTFRSVLGEAATLINMALVYEDHGQDDKAATLRAQAYAMDPDLRPATDKEVGL